MEDLTSFQELLSGAKVTLEEVQEKLNQKTGQKIDQLFPPRSDDGRISAFPAEKVKKIPPAFKTKVSRMMSLEELLGL